MSATAIVGSLMGAFALGWCFGAGLLYLKRFMEITL